MVIGNESTSGGESQGVTSEVTTEGVNAETADAGDDGEEGELSYEQWLEKHEAEKAAKKAEPKKDQGKGKEEKRAKAASDDKPGSKDDDLSGKRDGKSEAEGKADGTDYLTLKVDGEELKLTKEQAITKLQKYEAAEVRIKEATEIKKQAGEFINFIKQNPIEALKRVGVDFYKLAEEKLYEKLQYEAMEPKDKEAFDTKQTLAQREAELAKYKATEEAKTKEIKEAAEKDRIEKATGEARAVLEQQMIHAMETTGLPRNKFTVTRMALYMKDAIAKGYGDVKPMDVADLVAADYKEAIDQARKSEVAKFQDRRQAANDQPRVTGHKPQRHKAKRITSIYDLID